MNVVLSAAVVVLICEDVRLASGCGDAGELVKDRAARRDLDRKHVGDDASPTVQKIDPAILDLKVARLLLCLRLLEEDEIASVVEFPNQPMLGEERRLRQRRAGRVLSKAGGVHDERAWRELRQNGV